MLTRYFNASFLDNDSTICNQSLSMQKKRGFLRALRDSVAIQMVEPYAVDMVEESFYNCRQNFVDCMMRHGLASQVDINGQMSGELLVTPETQKYGATGDHMVADTFLWVVKKGIIPADHRVPPDVKSGVGMAIEKEAFKWYGTDYIPVDVNVVHAEQAYNGAAVFKHGKYWITAYPDGKYSRTRFSAQNDITTLMCTQDWE